MPVKTASADADQRPITSANSNNVISEPPTNINDEEPTGINDEQPSCPNFTLNIKDKHPSDSSNKEGIITIIDLTGFPDKERADRRELEDNENKPFTGFYDAFFDQMGLGTRASEPPLYETIQSPPQTNEAFLKLIAAAKEAGVVYKSAKGKEKEDMLGLCMTTGKSWSNDAENICGENDMLSALMVSVQCQDGICRHCFILVMKTMDNSLLPSSALYLYRSLLSSQDFIAQSATLYIGQMDTCTICLATARKPVFMGDSYFAHLTTGFQHLGLLEALRPDCLILQSIDCTERTMLIDIYAMPNKVDVFMLYIWVGELNLSTTSRVSELNSELSTQIASPNVSVNTTYASRTSSSDSSQELIPSEFQTYIQMLGLLPSGQGKHTAFTGFMYVRMVTEICN